MTSLTELSIDFLTGSPFLTILGLIIAIGLAVYLYYRTNPPLPTPIRVLLVGLRMIAILALFLALFEPVFSYTREFERLPRVNLLIDQSRSMSVDENGLTRKQRIDSILASPSFMEFVDNFDTKSFYFGGNLSENKSSIDSLSTALGQILADLAKEESAGPAEAWILFSDGINNTGISPPTSSKEISSPIYSIGIGTDNGRRDIAITDVDYNQIAFVGKSTEVAVQIEWSGMDNEKVAINIKDGGKILASDTITVSPGNLKQDLVMHMIPEKIGRQSYSIEIPNFDNETNEENNSRSISMAVMKSRFNVLLVVDHYDWEYAFMSRYLERADNVDLTNIVYKADGTFLEGSFPSTQAELNRYDLIIFYDIKPNLLRACEDIIHSFVAEKGGSIFFMLGQNYLTSGRSRWVDNFLPFVTKRLSAKLLYTKYNGIPSESFLFHPAIRLSDDRRGVRERWRDLPNFETLVPLDSVTAQSKVLVTADLGRNAAEYPVLGYKVIGAGKILAMTAAPLWHWSFLSIGFDESGSDYERFWDGAIKWLSLKEDFDPIKIVPDRDIYTKGDEVGFTAFVYDQGFRPIEKARGFVELFDESGGDTVIVPWDERGEGKYRAEFKTLSPGQYNYRGIVNRDGAVLKETSGQLVVESYFIEDLDYRPDFAALEAVSSNTGGAFLYGDRADSLLSLIDDSAIFESVRREISVWDKVWLLFIFIGALAIEWLLRKRYQLI